MPKNTFDEYWETLGIIVEHLIMHVHTQNGLEEFLILVQIVALY